MPILHRYPWLAHSPKRSSTMAGPIEIKVPVTAVASTLSGLGVWALQTYVFHGEVPMPVFAAVQTLVPVIVGFIAGWLAPHTPRPDLRPEVVDVAATKTGGEHALDGEGRDGAPEMPVSLFDKPSATRHAEGDVPR